MQTQGIVAISDIPEFAKLRKDVLLGSYVCAKKASAARTTVFGDGTSRRTIASIAKGTSSLDDIQFGDFEDDACSEGFRNQATTFRNLVSNVAQAFAERMSETFNIEHEPLLWEFDHKRSYNSFKDIVENADHLEHFHTYYRPPSVSETTVGGASDTSTIDLHADQGLFIAFVPSFLVEDSDMDGFAKVIPGDSGKFYLELLDKTQTAVDFGSGDVLVFMLGDGVDQYFNTKVPQDQQLRSAPHGMTMPKHSETQARVWYGRMFLPPANALSEAHGVSFAQLRQKMIEEVQSGGGVGTGLGCSRMLLEQEGLQCADNQMYCWMRCMDYTEDVHEQACADQGKDLKCVSQRDEIWKPADSHGDYNPMCTDSNANVTVEPSIPPRPNTCGPGFEAFVGSGNYTNSQTFGFAQDTVILWKVVGDKIHIKMAYNGIAGYLAVGFRSWDNNVSHKGMNGAHIVHGVYDPDPLMGWTTEPTWRSPAPFVGTSVQERIIDHDESAFRHWMAAFTPASLEDSSIEVTDCYTSMTFITDTIAGQKFNMTDGNTTNHMIYAVHKDTWVKGYHGYGNRGFFTIDLTNSTLVEVSTPAPASANSGVQVFSMSAALLCFVGMIFM
eukprot:CAMPEP_0196581494 /NCGR_PEP_ID=MMETSP1081-20130531/33998_1 /TAXON_ID=36882 /ORGANISM="Pyramimonas amylifera, Strain CCMP720" /LENGTH=611 /DNA_ID=CAMNT_0041901747 /DNA_START=266 /DNA_END=2101 /DNA_ORIENTATION=+